MQHALSAFTSVVFLHGKIPTVYAQNYLRRRIQYLRGRWGAEGLHNLAIELPLGGLRVSSLLLFLSLFEIHSMIVPVSVVYAMSRNIAARSSQADKSYPKP